MSANEIRVGEAIITDKVAKTLAVLQRNNNEEIDMNLENIGDLKNYLINLDDTDEDAKIILLHLSRIQYLEHYIKDLKVDTQNNCDERL